MFFFEEQSYTAEHTGVQVTVMYVRWAHLKRHLGGNTGKSIVRPHFSPLVRCVFLVSKRSLFFLLGVGGVDASCWSRQASGARFWE